MMLTDDAFGIQDIGIALKLGNDELTKFMDDTLTELKESGRLDELKAKWGILTDKEVEAMRRSENAGSTEGKNEIKVVALCWRVYWIPGDGNVPFRISRSIWQDLE